VSRYKLIVEYDGAPFQGWQRQENGPSVQQTLEEAVHGFSGETVVVEGAGRTDSGVHATAQTAHFDLPTDRFDASVVMNALNAHLRAHPISVLSAEHVPDDFHARFSATWRSYRYAILNRPAPPAIELGRVWHVQKPLDVERMRAGAAYLIGHHDFTTFRATQCQARSPEKTLDRLEIERVGEHVIVKVQSRSFLHNQVRIMVGTLKLVGEGKWTPERVGQALAARDRRAGGQTAPAQGLYLTGVGYD
jgi:tRNA pseudouridine38-40 synthase